jgi:hypothetical protein
MTIDNYNTFLGKAYRFISFDGLYNTIENKSLRFTRIDKLNDPLDSSPFLGPYDWANCNPTNNILKNALKNSFSPLTTKYYICCFCKEYDTADSYLMWSHYGEHHSQLCFEFDFLKNQFLGGPSEIYYPDDLNNYRKKKKDNPNVNIGLYLATTKIKQWSHEKEVRLIIDKDNHGIDEKLNNSLTDNEHIYVNLDLSYISKVVFGVNAEKQNENKIIDMFSKLGLSPVYEKMVIDAVTLKLKPVDYKEYY